MDSLTKKKTGSHYTADQLSDFMAERLFFYYKKFKNNFFENKVNIIDPSCGEGNLLFSLAEKLKSEVDKVIGIDTNANVLGVCRNNLSDLNNVYLHNDDYTKLIIQSKKNVLSSLNLIQNSALSEVDLIIANPPYVRTQMLGAEQSKSFSKSFNLNGRIDLYQVFLVAMTKHLRENGLICVITSNRYLTTTGGKDIRDFLGKNYEILEIIDLGDTKLFEAAVLPAIFIGRKKEEHETIENNNVKFTKIYEHESKSGDFNINSRENLFEVLNAKKNGFYEVQGKCYNLTIGTLSVPSNSNELWKMATDEEKKWSDLIKSNAKYVFDDVFKVKVGIKTTADSVFIRKNWGIVDTSPEEELLFPLISSKNIQKWTTVKEQIDNKILYTHKNVGGKKIAIDLNEFPKARAYLSNHRERLEGRSYLKKANRNWYEIWVPQNPCELGKSKVVFPDISPIPKFSLDLAGNMVDGNCYWLSLREDFNEEILYLATAVANSSIMNKFHEIEFQNVLYSGRKRYLTQYVKNYLLPNPNNEHSKNAISLVKKIINQQLSPVQISAIETEIDLEIEKSFFG